MSINENELNTNTTPNKKENIINNVKLILPKNFTIINKSRSIRKLFALERFSPKNKMFLKLKVENPTEISNKKILIMKIIIKYLIYFLLIIMK